MTGRDGYFRSAEISSQQFIERVQADWMNRLQATSMVTYSIQVRRCIEIALSCVDPDRHKRPSIGVIVNILNETESSNKILDALRKGLESPIDQVCPCISNDTEMLDTLKNKLISYPLRVTDNRGTVLFFLRGIRGTVLAAPITTVGDPGDTSTSEPVKPRIKIIDCTEDKQLSDALPLSRPLSGMFHHTPWDDVAYAPFDPLRAAATAKPLIPDPAFAAFSEEVTILASARGLVCLRGGKSGLYYVANPDTFRRVLLPPNQRDHRLDADPAVVITFESPNARKSSAVGDFLHYHVVVTFQVHDGVWAVETFSSRTWEWTIGSDICAPETVIASSGVGALGRAFWRTTIGHILCVTPETGAVDLIPAPHEVDARPQWEIGEMEGNFSVACADHDFRELVVLYLVVPGGAGGEIQWAWVGQFDGKKAGCHPGMTLLRSQGAAEVVVWDSVAELVINMDFGGRQTRSIGPLVGGHYYTDFIPYIGSETEIYSEEVGAVYMTVDAVTFRIPQPSVKEETEVSN